MNDLHIDDFYKDTAVILARLYSVFPRKTAIYVEDISGPDTVDEFGLHSDRYLACLSTMIWLSEEGYIRFEDTIKQEAIDQATLTHKGFTRLSKQATQSTQSTQEPQDNRPFLVPETYIKAIKRALNNKSSQDIKAVIEYYLNA